MARPNWFFRFSRGLKDLWNKTFRPFVEPALISVAKKKVQKEINRLDK